MTLLSRTMLDWSSALVALMLLAALAAPGAARAGGGASCGLSATPLAFGAYVPASNTPSDFTATITLICTASGTAPVPVHGTIALTGTGGPSGHRLTHGARQMRYQLYLDPARTALWGNGGGGGGTAPISGVAAGLTSPFRQTLTVYGRILARQSNMQVGDYTDRITVVLNY